MQYFTQTFIIKLDTIQLIVKLKNKKPCTDIQTI